MRFFTVVLIIFSLVIIQCSKDEPLSPMQNNVEILKIQKYDPNLLEITVQNCCDSRKYVAIEVTALDDRTICSKTIFIFNEKDGLAPDESCCKVQPLQGISTHKEYLTLAYQKFVSDEPFPRD